MLESRILLRGFIVLNSVYNEEDSHRGYGFEIITCTHNKSYNILYKKFSVFLDSELMLWMVLYRLSESFLNSADRGSKVQSSGIFIFNRIQFVCIHLNVSTNYPCAN
jgi:hypothetical protein